MFALTSAPTAADSHLRAACVAGAPGSGTAVDEARAKGIPWVTILTLLSQGLQALLAFLSQPKPPAPAGN